MSLSDMDRHEKGHTNCNTERVIAVNLKLAALCLVAAVIPDIAVAPGHQAEIAIEWIERWSMALHINLPWDSYSEVPKDIVD